MPRKLIGAVAVAALIASCGPLPRSRTRGGGTSGGEAAFTSQCRGDFGAGATASRFEALMLATYELHEAAAETEQALAAACRDMGQALEMPAASLEGDTRTVCTAVRDTLQTELAAIREGSDATVELRTQPPRCEARFDAFAECAARCDVNVTAGELELSCEGGEIRGQCSGSCSGSCAVELEARCEGTCEGLCEGTCSRVGPDGQCLGACDGTCRGQCVADASASCSGECRGSCSVEWERPYCTGHYQPPQVEADCRAACEAHVDASLECTPGRAELVVSGGPDEETQARMARVREAVRIGIASVHTVRERAQRLARSGRDVLAQLEGLPDAIREIGVSAAACSLGALADLRASMTSITVSVEVSVSVSASVEGGPPG